MAAVEGEYFLDGSTLSNSTAVYINVDLTIKALNGYYAADGIVRFQSEGVLVSTSDCVDCTGNIIEITGCDTSTYYAESTYPVTVGDEIRFITNAALNTVECGVVANISASQTSTSTIYGTQGYACDFFTGQPTMQGTYPTLGSMYGIDFGSNQCTKTDYLGNIVNVSINSNMDSNNNGWKTISYGVCEFGAGNGISLGWGFELTAQPIAADHTKIYTLNVYFTPVGSTEQLSPIFSATSSGTGNNTTTITRRRSNGLLNFLEGNFRIEIQSTEQVTFDASDITLDGEISWVDTNITSRETTLGTLICSGSPTDCAPSSTACDFYSQQLNSQQVVTSNHYCGITI
jgi:hypothetical protein